MADNDIPANKETKKAENKKIDVKALQLLDRRLDSEGKPDYKLKESIRKIFVNEVELANLRVGSLSIKELKARQTGLEYDGKLTLEEVIASNAYSRAYEIHADDFKKALKDGDNTFEKIIPDTIKILQSDPKIIEAATSEFKKLEKEFPDNKPGDGVIDINEVAAKKIDALKNDFPELMQKLTDSLKPSDLGENQSPIKNLRTLFNAVSELKK